jgi:hypothetical protein
MENSTYCQGCEEKKETTDFAGYKLCKNCIEKYDDKTGHCSLECCINGRCDESC